jgi:preprotein translocase subunit SecA
MISAYVMEENKEYSCGRNRVRCIDFYNTGSVLGNTSLSHGLHQFLQAKCHFRITPEARTTNFLSNYSFFKQYKTNIIGLTGTIGTKDTQYIFNKVYDCDCYKMPKMWKEREIRLPTIAEPS